MSKWPKIALRHFWKLNDHMADTMHCQ